MKTQSRVKLNCHIGSNCTEDNNSDAQTQMQKAIERSWSVSWSNNKNDGKTERNPQSLNFGYCTHSVLNAYIKYDIYAYHTHIIL